MIICRSNNNQWFTLISVTFFAVIFIAAVSYTSNRLSLLSLPSSPWLWRWPSSVNLHHHCQSSLLQPLNPRTALYSMFHCDSDACKKQNAKMNKQVSKLIMDLKNETLLRRNRKKIDKKLQKVEAELGRARVLIRDAGINHNRSSYVINDRDYIPTGSIYRNPYMFHRSYLLMEKLFKVYIYEEGERPLFHTGPTTEIYSMEGVFLNSMENDPKFRVSDPDRAHVYFLPFSVVMILHNLFDPIIRDKAVLERVIKDYVHIVSSRYPYWNRSLGSDHFMLSCHDWVGA